MNIDLFIGMLMLWTGGCGIAYGFKPSTNIMALHMFVTSGVFSVLFVYCMIKGITYAQFFGG